MSTSMSDVVGYPPGTALPEWASEWQQLSDAPEDRVPIRPITGEMRVEAGTNGRPVIYTSLEFVDGHGCVDPADARQLAAALLEAADVLDKVNLAAISMPTCPEWCTATAQHTWQPLGPVSGGYGTLAHIGVLNSWNVEQHDVVNREGEHYRWRIVRRSRAL